MKTLTTALLVGATILTAAVTTPAATITLKPDKDNTLIQTTNPGIPLSNGQGDLFVGRTNQDGSGPAVTSIRRGLVHFDVAGSLPANALITGATLSLRETKGLNGDQTTVLRRVLADWGEGTSFFDGATGAPPQNNDATWLYTFYNFANPAASPTWATPGGDFSATVSGSTVVAAGAPGQVFSWNDPQIVADVQDWYANSSANFGWGILGNESTGKTAKGFNSGEATTAPAVPPQLVIEYTIVPEPAGGVLALLGILSVATIGWRRAAQR